MSKKLKKITGMDR